MNYLDYLNIAVIAKECLPGKVKTRLAPPMTPDQAAQLAQSSLSQTLSTVRELPLTQRILYFDGTPRLEDAQDFLVIPQILGNLDERIATIFDLVLDPLLIIGMDTPQLNAEHLAALFADWDSTTPQYDAWLGLASDGGFWALALRDVDHRGNLIRGVPMSKDTTGEQQLQRLKDAKLRVGLLPTLGDMDYAADAKELAFQCPGSNFARQVEHYLGTGSTLNSLTRK